MAHKHSLKFLVADDHAIIRRTLAEVLRCQFDAEVEVAADGVEALQKLRQHRDLDVAVLDISMPGKTGLQVLEEFRKERDEIDFVVISAHGADMYEAQARSLGAYAFISKEQVSEKLVPCIQKIVAANEAAETAKED